jgi:hypothetical protein
MTYETRVHASFVELDEVQLAPVTGGDATSTLPAAQTGGAPVVQDISITKRTDSSSGKLLIGH